MNRTDYIFKCIDSEFVGSYESFRNCDQRFRSLLNTISTILLIFLIRLLITQNYILLLLNYTKVLINLIYLQLSQYLNLPMTFQLPCSLIVLIVDDRLLWFNIRETTSLHVCYYIEEIEFLELALSKYNVLPSNIFQWSHLVSIGLLQLSSTRDHLSFCYDIETHLMKRIGKMSQL